LHNQVKGQGDFAGVITLESRLGLLFCSEFLFKKESISSKETNQKPDALNSQNAMPFLVAKKVWKLCPIGSGFACFY